MHVINVALQVLNFLIKIVMFIKQVLEMQIGNFQLAYQFSIFWKH